MSGKLFKSAGIAGVIAMGSSGCSNLTPGENAGVFGTLTAVAVGVPLAAAGVDSSIAIPVTLGAAALAATGAYIYAKHQADAEQRRIAEARARLYLARQAKEQADDEAIARQASTPASKKKKPAPRYIAVETKQADGYQGKAAVMIYDTKSQELVGNNVYDLKSAPKAGTVSKYDTVQAQYVGAGT